MSYLTRGLYQQLRFSDEDRYSEDDDPTLAYQPWGFSIYRTAYGPESEGAWQTLINTIGQQAREDLRLFGETKADEERAARLSSCFHLDLGSDEDALRGADMHRVRRLHREVAAESGVWSEENFASRQYFLLADEEVLADVATGDFWVKCVQADYEADRYASRCARTPQRYFGWMKTTARTLSELWGTLEEGLDRIAPPTIGGMHLVTWEGDPYR
ncbi:hypothetical protein CkaCkLH20_05423 [Colletotrichum karsti]|uniref:Uncharacterized protein n=1 Tax=Colletotrichum karsti TaxID=1095194 RepID=A0A9P6LM32_9PEZI|nr:uncharacterized protein CkaCkLH20_05423 [Colletotrichum karsti]KAF9877157.1 hypothetical protein CkaCkLH20_05423 [Colletotrichum karsti]